MRRDDAQAPLLMLVRFDRLDAPIAGFTNDQNSPLIKLLIVTSLVAASWALVGYVTWTFI